MRWLKQWWPVLVWAIVISGFSTGAFTGENTSRVILPILHWLFPQASPDTLGFLHHVIRKCGHFTEYFVFSYLILRAIRGPRRETHLKWALAAILLVAGYAALDEFHQSFIPGRTPAVADVLLDTIGGASAQLFAWLIVFWQHVRGERNAGEA